MQKEDIIAIAQLLSAIKELIPGLERAQGEGDNERIMRIKKEILSLQGTIARRIETL